MGNTNSSSNGPNPPPLSPLSQRNRRLPSAGPASASGSRERSRTNENGSLQIPPGAPIRHKKKSLELPDLANLNITSPTYPHHSPSVLSFYKDRGRQPGSGSKRSAREMKEKSQAIPIPVHLQLGAPIIADDDRPSAREELRRRDDIDSNVDDPENEPPAIEISTHIPIHAHRGEPIPTPSAAIESRGSMRRRQVTILDAPTITDLLPGPPPPTRNPSMAAPGTTPNGGNGGFQPITVHSSIPQPSRREEFDNGITPVKVSWSGGGDVVYLIRAGDDEKTCLRRKMSKDTLDGPHTATLHLPQGIHHFRFLVDDQWRVADDLPAAVDDIGSLANYVAIGLDGGVKGGVVDEAELPESQPASPPIMPPVPGQSFWSRASTVEEADDASLPSSSSPADPKQPAGPTKPRHPVVWTSEIPLELTEAAQEEEQYLQETQHQYHGSGHNNGRTQVISGFVPLPQIPPAPALPRHLERLLLNTKPSGREKGSKANSASPAAGNGGSVVGGGRGPHATPKKKESRKTRERGRTLTGSATTPSTPGQDSPPKVSVTDSTADSNSAHSTMQNSVTNSPTTPTLPPSGAAESVRGPSPAPSQTHLTVPLRTSASLDDAVIADDNSVLPVPSHVVLHHLSTSAIKNGVLAVGQTVRYKKKYLTTVYYKPTELAAA